MTKKNIGISFSDAFKVDENWLNRKKIFNPTLDIDSPLFIDPFLLPGSIHPEFSDCAFNAYEERFTQIYNLLSKYDTEQSKIWRAALRLFDFSETKGIGGTCLGYSKKSTSDGRAFGPILSERALKWALEVIELGVKDPELFSCLPLFEDGIGADLISDMITNIATECILSFNNRILREIDTELDLKLERDIHSVNNRQAKLPTNPYSGAPILLVAADVLKHLPILDDPRGLSKVAEDNDHLRDRVNQHIGEIFKIRTKKEKAAVKESAMQSAAAFQTLLDLMKILENKPYNIHKDPQGLLEWRLNANTFSSLYELKITDHPELDRVSRIDAVCIAIIEKFQDLVENKRLSKTFYVDRNPRHERYAQLLFYAIAHIYCEANDIDISPEADAGAGPVDFKFSSGLDKVVVEIKLSTNSHVVSGYKKQLTAYMKAESTDRGHYVVIDVGKIGKKWEKLTEIAREHRKFESLKRIHLIDGNLKPSASLL